MLFCFVKCSSYVRITLLMFSCWCISEKKFGPTMRGEKKKNKNKINE